MHALSVLAVSLSLAQELNSTELKAEIQRLEPLVAAGAIAPAKLNELRYKLADAEDAATLERTLYGKLAREQFTEDTAREMIGAAERRLTRLRDRLSKLQALVDAGVAPRTEREPLALELAHRETVVSQAKARAALFSELVEMARAEQMVAAASITPSSVLDGPAAVVEHFQGAGKFNDGDLKRIVLEFEREFEKPLPVSARGETAVHKSLGFDHRGRVDVGVNPDSSEGQWLRKFLIANRIPYIAFRGKVAGQATAPHIHIGPPSPRLALAD